MTTANDEVVLRFRPLRDTRSLAVRVRHLLKYALRTCNLRCIRVEGLPDDPSPTVKQENQAQ